MDTTEPLSPVDDTLLAMVGTRSEPFHVTLLVGGQAVYGELVTLRKWFSAMVERGARDAEVSSEDERYLHLLDAQLLGTRAIPYPFFRVRADRVDGWGPGKIA